MTATSKVATKVKVQILVFKGDPDLPDYRHTALLVEESSLENLLCHIVGEAPNFRKDIVSDYRPTASKTLLRTILVGEITKSDMTKVAAICLRTPIKSSRGSRWNCQNWIEDALDAICKEKWITEDAKSSAIKGMWEAVRDQQEGDTVHAPAGRHANHSIPEQQSASTTRHGSGTAIQSLPRERRIHSDAGMGVFVGGPLFPRTPDPQSYRGEQAQDRASTSDKAKLDAARWRQLPPTRSKDLKKSQSKVTKIDGHYARTWASSKEWIFEADIRQ